MCFVTAPERCDSISAEMEFGPSFPARSAHGSFWTPTPRPWASNVPNLRSARQHFPVSFRALATRYFASPQFLSLSATSQTNYRRAIDRFLIAHGHRRVDQMKREHVDGVLGKFVDKPGAGIILLKRMRTLLRYAIEIGWRDGDPTAGVRAFKSVEIHTWTESEIGQFESRWPIGTKQRLAFDLLLYTGQRGGDVARMIRPGAGAKIR